MAKVLHSKDIKVKKSHYLRFGVVEQCGKEMVFCREIDKSSGRDTKLPGGFVIDSDLVSTITKGLYSMEEYLQALSYCKTNYPEDFPNKVNTLIKADEVPF